MSHAHPAKDALDDYQAGVYSIPIPLGGKAPATKKWQTLRLAPEKLNKVFRQPFNRGRLLGIEPPDGTNGRGHVLCVDLDTAEAVLLSETFLPQTGEIGGRRDCPQSHWFYECSPAPATTRYTDVDGTRLLELLSRGCQVLVPPSIHPSGLPYIWFRQEGRSTVETDELLSACSRLATACLIARHWPRQGSRQDTALALAGALFHGGWTPEDCQRFIRAVTTSAHDEEVEKRVATVSSTANRLGAGDSTSGWPTLARMLGDQTVELARRWLGVRSVPYSIILEREKAPTDRPRPAPLKPEAYHGLAGKVVRTIEPHTEADNAALLFQFLTAFGNAVGRAPYFPVEATHHRTNLFTVVVGNSSKARKGTSWDHILRIFKLAGEHQNVSNQGRNAHWLKSSIKDGLSSGEGLIYHVRDPEKKVVTNKNGEKREIVIDEGIEDKRLLIQTGEFIGSLRCMSRSGNTLSAILRSAWDSGDLRILTRNNAISATQAHISMIGHITGDELRSSLSDVEFSNGFANRFLWVSVMRSKLLPEGSHLADDALHSIASELARSLEHSSRLGRITRDEEAACLWRETYPHLSRDRQGIMGYLAGRAEAQVVRLSMIYALLDCSHIIECRHLQAALEAWRYAEESAHSIFGDATDPTTAAILQALKNNQEGLTRTNLNNLFGRHKDRQTITQSLYELKEGGLVHVVRQTTKGRPREIWYARV